MLGWTQRHKIEKDTQKTSLKKPKGSFLKHTHTHPSILKLKPINKSDALKIKIRLDPKYRTFLCHKQPIYPGISTHTHLV